VRRLSIKRAKHGLISAALGVDSIRAAAAAPTATTTTVINLQIFILKI
jgi:hypothetical protein